MNERILQVIGAALRDLGEELRRPELERAGPETRLYGPKSPLDSMALVSLIADLEARLAAEFGRDLVLADERAMSQARSPFRTVGSLADHIGQRLAEKAP